MPEFSCRCISCSNRAFFLLTFVYDICGFGKKKKKKRAILFWLVAPYFKGATQIYNRLVNPYLHRYEKDIDAGVEKVKRHSARQLGQIGQLGIKHIRSHSAELLRMGTQALSTASSENLLQELEKQQEQGVGAEEKE